MATIKRRAGNEPWVGNLIDRAIEEFGDGSPSEFAKKLSRYAGREISKQTVVNWRRRGRISRELISAVHKLTGISFEVLLEASD
jgi:hypothetical protein